MPRTLLVVDDSTTMQQAARLALTGEEWTVIGAPGLDDALDLLRSRQPDAVLCDARLGDSDGYEACRSIRGTIEGASIPVILTGAKIDESAALQAGAAGTLAKPFSSEDLSSTLSSTLDGGLFSLENDDFGPAESSPEEPSFATDAFGAENTLELTPVVAGYDDEKVRSDVEIIDLATEDDFGDLEMLEDLPPLDPLPVTVEEPLDLGAAPDQKSATLDLGGLDLEEPSDAAAPETSFEPDLTLPGAEFHTEPVSTDVFETRSGATLYTREPVKEEPSAPADLGPGAPKIEILAEGVAILPEPSPLELDLAGEHPRGAEPKTFGSDRGPEVEPAGFPIEFASEPPAPQAQPELPTYGTEPPDDFGMHDADTEAQPVFDSLFDEAINGVEATEATAPPELDPDSVPAHSPLATVVEIDGEEPFEIAAAGPVAEADLDAEAISPAPRVTTDDEEPTATTFEFDARAEPAAGEIDIEVSAAPISESVVGGADTDLPSWETPAVPPVDAPWPADEIRPELSPWDQAAETPRKSVDVVSTETVSLDTSAVETAVREALGQSLSSETLSPLVQATVERVVWEVVPQLAERMIREAIERMKDAPGARVP